MQRGRGAPSLDGDRTAESIVGTAIPMKRKSHGIRDLYWLPLRHARRPILGIDGKTNSRRTPTLRSRAPGRDSEAAR